MELLVQEYGSVVEITIKGNIKSISDTDSIKSTIQRVWDKDKVEDIGLKIDNSFIITSSVIGFLIKFIKKDKIPISLYVRNQELYDMLDDMNLIEALNVRR